jgi:hypothetical protein
MPRARSSSHRTHLILITGADLGTTGQVCEAWPVGPLKSAPLLHRTVPRLPRRPPHLVFSEKCGVISLTPSAGEDRLISCPQHIRAVGRSRCLWSNHICHHDLGVRCAVSLGTYFWTVVARGEQMRIRVSSYTMSSWNTRNGLHGQVSGMTTYSKIVL